MAELKIEGLWMAGASGEHGDLARPPRGDGFTPDQVRLLKIAVVGMGVFIVLALVAIVWRIFYLASAPPAPTVRSNHSIATQPLDLPAVLPPGAAIRQMALGDGRLAVHWGNAEGSAGIVVIDLASGRVSHRVAIENAPR